MHPPMFVYVESFNAIDGRSITFLDSSQSFGNSGRRRLLMAESYLRLRKAGADDATATHRRSAALGAVCHRRLPPPFAAAVSSPPFAAAVRRSLLHRIDRQCHVRGAVASAVASVLSWVSLRSWRCVAPRCLPPSPCSH